MERDLTLNATVDASGVTKGLDEVKAAAVEAGTSVAQAGDKAAEGLKEIPSAASDAYSALEKMGDAGARIAELARKMEDPATAARALGRLAAMAAVEIEEMRDALERSGESADEIAEVEAALDKVSASAIAAATRAEKVADSAGDMASQGRQAAKGFEQLGQDASSLEGALGKLADTAGGGTAKFAAFGVGLLGMAQGIQQSIAFFTEVDAKMKEMGIDLGKIGGDLIAAGLGWSEYGNGIGLVTGPINASIKAHQAHEAAARDAAAAMKAAIPGWETSAAAVAKTETEIKALDAVIVNYSKTSGGWSKEIENNAVAIVALGAKIAPTAEAFAKLTPAVQSAILMARGFVQAAEDTATRTKTLEAAQRGVNEAFMALPKDLAKTYADIGKELGEALDVIARKRAGLSRDSETYTRDMTRLADEEAAAWIAAEEKKRGAMEETIAKATELVKAGKLNPDDVAPWIQGQLEVQQALKGTGSEADRIGKVIKAAFDVMVQGGTAAQKIEDLKKTMESLGLVKISTKPFEDIGGAAAAAAEKVRALDAAIKAMNTWSGGSDRGGGMSPSGVTVGPEEGD